MYVQYVKLYGSYARAKYPLLMWHGGGLSGVTWETKPDGQPGWQQFFLRAGHDVYVSDAVERGRASWARYPEIFKTEPFFRTKKEAWELFRIGPADSYATDPGAAPGARRGHAVPGRRLRPVRQAGHAALGDQRCVDAGRIRRAGAEGLPLRGHRPFAGRQLHLQRRAQGARQDQGGDRGGTFRRARSGERRTWRS